MGDRRRFSESSRVEWARFWRRGLAAASCWGEHLLTVRCGAALLVLCGCVVGDKGLVLLVCLTFVSLVRGVLGRGEEGAGVVDIGVVVRFWNKRTDVVTGSVSVSEALPALHWVGTVGRLVLSFL